MHDRSKSTPPPDLTRYTEATRRELYDRIAFEHFAQGASPAAESEDFIETRSPEEAGLAVVYVLGRWFAFWKLADPPETPSERERWELVTISSGPHGLTMAEV